MKFKEAEHFGDCLSIAFLKLKELNCREPVLENLQTQKSISAYLFKDDDARDFGQLDNEYARLISEIAKKQFLLSLLSLINKNFDIDDTAYDHSGYLNDVHRNEVVVLPSGGKRLSCYLECSRSLHHKQPPYGVLDKDYSSFSFCDMAELKALPDFFMMKGLRTVPFFISSKRGSCKLSFRAIPFFNGNLETYFSLHRDYILRLFSIEGEKLSGAATKRYEQALGSLFEEDFIIFPELSLSKTSKETIESTIAKNESLKTNSLLLDRDGRINRTWVMSLMGMEDSL